MIKTTEKPKVHQVIHKIPAGLLPTDRSIELFGDRRTNRVFFMHNGKTLPFCELKNKAREQLLQLLMNDKVAMKDLKHLPINEALEQFAFCVFGTLDHEADVDADGNLGNSDNFMCGKATCNCKHWKSKNITFQGTAIKGKLLQVLTEMANPGDDRQHAENLGIALSTLYTHKKKLFSIFNVFNTSELIVKAIEAKIIQ
ncbi:DNA-binding response regulator [Muricauda sp. SCSIO 64092]|uniref:helix-turn-helix transcriptional regulator n=1 Tax=Allomuricauda sp. SCSIO 64092 TaxID=2908842 RepID=UPI001FF25D1C|nr:DNA-binding response regulator [Muricauda sp. SCSIO 64092]UOY07752.1 DNA-binding response regulator [Muricauda sp. SCSIO 64092]